MINEIIKAFEAGKELSNPAGWKKGQELTNLIGAVIAGIVTLLRYFFPDILVPDGATEYIAEIIGGILVLINLYLTRATTKKNIVTATLSGEIK